MSITRFNWTEESIDKLRKLWNEGVPASKIAQKLGPTCTRSAVLGKVHRFKKTAKRLAPRAHAPPKGPVRYAPGKPPTLAPLQRMTIVKMDLSPPPDTGRVQLMQLTPSTCRWPMGDPRGKDFCYCGAAPRAGSPYCAYHARLGTDKPPPRK